MRAFPLLLLVACTSQTDRPGAPPPLPSRPSPTPIVPADPPPDLARIWPEGCFTFRDASGTVHASDRTRCARPRRPYSTFKIPNALLGVEAGLLAGPDAEMRWDKARIPDTKELMDAWRKPHTLRSGMKVSAVPHFRTLAIDLGAERMKAGLATLEYGNQDMSGGLDLFWLRKGGLLISADQQLAFVEKLARKQLPVSVKAQQAVTDVIELARVGDAVLYGKTGTGGLEDGGDAWLAWQVGWVDRKGVITPYAVWFETPIDNIMDVRAERERRLRAALDALDVFPNS
jgi:beta-lactamase class D